MSEPEKKGSPWPWILVPVAAISLFFVLRQCRQNLPPANQVTSEEAAPASVDPVPAEPPAVEPEAPPPAATPPAQ